MACGHSFQIFTPCSTSGRMLVLAGQEPQHLARRGLPIDPLGGEQRHPPVGQIEAQLRPEHRARADPRCDPTRSSPRSHTVAQQIEILPFGVAAIGGIVAGISGTGHAAVATPEIARLPPCPRAAIGPPLPRPRAFACGTTGRGVAQPGRALSSGGRGRRFRQARNPLSPTNFSNMAISIAKNPAGYAICPCATHL